MGKMGKTGNIELIVSTFVFMVFVCCGHFFFVPQCIAGIIRKRGNFFHKLLWCNWLRYRKNGKNSERWKHGECQCGAISEMRQSARFFQAITQRSKAEWGDSINPPVVKNALIVFRCVLTWGFFFFVPPLYSRIQCKNTPSFWGVLGKFLENY
jgi:hypothetical protein